MKDFAQAAEDLGYEHLLVFDHVLGADASKREHWERPYSHTDTFHEPFVLFGYLAAITEKIEMTTGILILPQRQTALVAKQAAAVDVLTGAACAWASASVGTTLNTRPWGELRQPGPPLRRANRVAEAAVDPGCGQL